MIQIFIVVLPRTKEARQGADSLHVFKVTVKDNID